MHADFTAALSRATDPGAAHAALHRLAEATVGVRLFTVMLVDIEAGLARRAYTSHPEAYPTSGTKPIRRDAWFAMLERGETYVAPRLSEVTDQFPDHALIASLGCGSVANLPVRLGGRLLGSVNLLDAEGRYTPAVVPALCQALALPALAALLAAERLA